MIRVGEIMSGQPLPKEARPFVEEMADRENRALIRLSRSHGLQYPVHLNAGDDGSKMRHGQSSALEGVTASSENSYPPRLAVPESK